MVTGLLCFTGDGETGEPLCIGHSSLCCVEKITEAETGIETAVLTIASSTIAAVLTPVRPAI